MGTAANIHAAAVAFLEAVAAGFARPAKVVGTIRDEAFGQAELPLIAVGFPALASDRPFGDKRLSVYNMAVLVYDFAPPKESGWQTGLERVTDTARAVVSALDTGAWAPAAGDVFNRLATYAFEEAEPAGNNLARLVVTVTVQALE